MQTTTNRTRQILTFFAVWSAVGLAFSGLTLLGAVSENRPIDIPYALLTSVVCAYIWGLIAIVIFRAARRYRIEPGSLGFKNLALIVLLGIAVSVFYASIFVAYSWATTPEVFADSTLNSVLARRVLLPAFYTFFSLFVPTFCTIEALLFFRGYRSVKERNSQLQAAVSDARLNALKMQLHPHFLFNSLHAISSLVLVDPERANKMVALLGDFLRQTLDHSNHVTVTLDKELDFLRCYLAIEKIRFDDRLEVAFDIDKNAVSAYVPHLITQPIVENAIKHGIATFETKGRIDISAKCVGAELLISVINSGAHDPDHLIDLESNGNGHGIRNVRERLSFAYGGAGKLIASSMIGGGTKVDIAIPYMTEPMNFVTDQEAEL